MGELIESKAGRSLGQPFHTYLIGCDHELFVLQYN